MLVVVDTVVGCSCGVKQVVVVIGAVVVEFIVVAAVVGSEALVVVVFPVECRVGVVVRIGRF